MQDAFWIVLLVVVVGASIVAVITFALTDKTYAPDRARCGCRSTTAGCPSRPAPVSSAVRDDEIRQMLEARNERRVRRGQPPVDVEAELACARAAERRTLH